MNPSAAELPIPQAPPMLAEEDADTPKPSFELSDDDWEILRAALPETARKREADCLAWWRELPGLIASGQTGRFALLEGGKLVSIWDTHDDAIQAGYDKFGADRPFMAPKIEQRDLDRLRSFLVQERAKRCPK